jgi:hypothetical protein
MSIDFKDEVIAAAPRVASAAAVPLVRTPTQQALRDRAVDCIRGLAILWMASTHVAPESKLTALLHLPLYLSAFEWFSLLSGFILGMRAWRANLLMEVKRLMGSVRRQTFMLFRVHVLLVLAVLVANDMFGVFHSPSIGELGGWPQVLLLTATLALQPVDFMNILPLYIVMFLIAPVLIWMLNRGVTAILLGLSSALWVVSLLEPDLLPFPVIATGERVFSLLSWQFMFVLGLVAGYHREGPLCGIWARHKQKILLAALVIAGALFVFAQLQRKMAMGLGLQLPENLNWLLDKKTFGPVRAVYTISALLVAVHATRLLLEYSEGARSRLGAMVRQLLAELGAMGRRCLACFVLHLVFALTALALDISHRTQLLSELALIVSVLLLYGCVRLADPAKQFLQRLLDRLFERDAGPRSQEAA